MTVAPEPGTRWRHRNGNRYEVMMITNVRSAGGSDRYPTTVVYRNVDVGTLWSRPASEWARSFTLEGIA